MTKTSLIAILVVVGLGVVGAWGISRSGLERGDVTDVKTRSEASQSHDQPQSDAEQAATPGPVEEGGHEGESAVNLTSEEMKEFGVELRTAEPGTVKLARRLPGEVVLNPERVAHVVPRVPGVVREVKVGVGAQVEEGGVMAVLVSRELARAKSTYLAALTRQDLAAANFRRVEDLREQNITSEAEYLAAQQNLREARLDVQLAERELYALGLSKQAVASLPEQPARALARYELTAPIDGEVIERSITEGEVLSQERVKPPFIVADLSTVWAQLTIYPKDLAAVRPGQEVVITASGGSQETIGTIDYVSPIVGEATRTSTARVVLENSEGRWKPGSFITGRVRTGRLSGEVVVPKVALQTLNEQTVVFVQTPKGFVPQPVEVGRVDGARAQIISGLEPGQRYVAANPFILKAEITKGAFGGHGH